VAGSRADAHLNGLRDRLTTAAPRRLQRVAEHLEQRKHVLDGVAPRHLRRATERLDATEARVHAYDPARVLARGWSLTRAADGHLVRDPSEVAAGDTLITTLAGGQVTSTVESDDPATPQP
jgi:exodeoxyribonuclease VII large subunit